MSLSMPDGMDIEKTPVEFSVTRDLAGQALQSLTRLANVVAKLPDEARWAPRRELDTAEACVLRASALIHGNDKSAYLNGGGKSAPRGGLAPWQMRRTIAYIDANLEATIRIADCAAMSGLSASHFFRAFKQSFGVTPCSYIAQRRVAHAQKLMETTDATLADISIACGMCDQAHFSRLFRQIVGESPNAWRRRKLMGPSEEAPTLNRPMESNGSIEEGRARNSMGYLRGAWR